MDNSLFEAFNRERRLREEAYLGVPHDICGVPLNEITPRLLAVLFRLGTPYLTGGEVAPEDTLRFLWACHVDNPMRAEQPKILRRRFRKSIVIPTKRQSFLSSIKAGFPFQQAEMEIDQWLEDTFMDAPDGKPSKSYACSIAWLEYSMATKPFCWQRDYTLKQPLRVIYQLLRCRAIDNGIQVQNRISGAVIQGALDELNTPEEMEKRAKSQADFQRRYKEMIAREKDDTEGISFDDELFRLTEEFKRKLGGNN